MTSFISDSGIQLLVAAAITLLTVLFAVDFGRTPQTKTTNKFFLMDQTAGRFLIGFSYAASMISALLFIGLPGLFYTHGIGGWLYICLPVLVAVSVFAWYGVGVHRLQKKSGAHSPFEALSSAYSGKWIGALSFIITAIFVIPVIAMQLVGIGRLLQPFNIPYEVSVLTLVAFFVFYTIFAGMRGDVRSDLLQGGLMMAGIVFVLYLAWSLLQTIETLPATAELAPLFEIPGPNGLFTYPRMISLALMMGALCIAHGHYVMRFMIAKNEREIVKSMPVAALLIVLLYSSAAVIGLIGSVVAPGLESGDQLVGHLLSQAPGLLGPWGMLAGGIVISCILASSLSSVDSQFLALGASATRDIAANVFQLELSETAQLRMARIVMIAIGCAALLLALDPPQLIVQLAVFAASGTMALVPTFVGAVALKRRPPESVAVASIVFGFGGFLGLVFWLGPNGYNGWHPGVMSLGIATLVYLLGWFPSRNITSSLQGSAGPRSIGE